MTHSFPPRRSSDLGRTALLVPAATTRAGGFPMAARARASSFLGDERQDTRPPPHTSQSGGSCRSLRTCLSHMGPLQKGSGSHLHSFLRSEEHTSEPQSLMRISYAVFCLKKK